LPLSVPDAVDGRAVDANTRSNLLLCEAPLPNERIKRHAPFVPNRHAARNRKCASAEAEPRSFVWHYAAMVGQRHFIREWRKHRHLTQEQLAERIGVDRGYLSKIESGKRRYDQSFLEAAADALRCDPADLIVRDPTDPQGLWSIYDQLTPVQRVQLVAIGETLKKTA